MTKVPDDRDEEETPLFFRRYWRKLCEIDERLERIERLLHHHPAVRYVITIPGAEGQPMQIADNDTTKVATVSYVDAAGFPTTDDGATVAFDSSDATVLTVDASTGAVTPVGLGTATVSATVTNADGTVLTGDGVDVEVVAGPAASFTVAVN